MGCSFQVWFSAQPGCCCVSLATKTTCKASSDLAYLTTPTVIVLQGKSHLSRNSHILMIHECLGYCCLYWCLSLCCSYLLSGTIPFQFRIYLQNTTAGNQRKVWGVTLLWLYFWNSPSITSRWKCPCCAQLLIPCIWEANPSDSLTFLFSLYNRPAPFDDILVSSISTS